MRKHEVQQRVSLNGIPLTLDLFTWDEATNTFASALDNLVIDFDGVHKCVFITGSNCKFTTGGGCTFKAGDNCEFTTQGDCQFKTGSNCVFKTWEKCSFITDFRCSFTTGDSCQFKTAKNCTFNTGSRCVFDTPGDSRFQTKEFCIFKTCGECSFAVGSGSVLVRDDTDEIIQFDTASQREDKIFILNGYGKPGFRAVTGECIVAANGRISGIVYETDKCERQCDETNMPEIGYVVTIDGRNIGATKISCKKVRKILHI